MPYVIQNMFIVLAPALFAASIYASLGRIIIFAKSESYSPIRPNRVTLIFVLGDVLSFLVQSSSPGLMYQKSTQKIGNYLIIAGLGIQIVMFGLFGLLAMVWHVRVSKDKGMGGVELGDESRWKSRLVMLYAVSVFVMI